tara:strand:+ start:31 stop:195 length:165 start_codon:yes stop_codon:yes gene_type:complete
MSKNIMNQNLLIILGWIVGSILVRSLFFLDFSPEIYYTVSALSLLYLFIGKKKP